jgi:L-alanine-DL-glutamate epimerase-like enolase superfamily enzyme
MTHSTDVRTCGAELYFLPVETRVPLKFGPETLTYVTCARVRLEVVDASGRIASGWGETPLSVQWAWPSQLSYSERHEALRRFCRMLTSAWAKFAVWGHPMEVGHAFQRLVLPGLLKELNQERNDSDADAPDEPMPWLAALICCSAFDIALHDAYGVLHGQPIYELYGPPHMNDDLSAYLAPAAGTAVSFENQYPRDFFAPVPDRLPAWHLVGGLDLLTAADLRGDEPDDGYPVVLEDWIARDGLKCLKVKLRGTDAAWDYDRLVHVGQIALAGGADWLTSDFNCTVTDPSYVNDILDRLMAEHPRLYGMILYVEQPFPYELAENRIDVHSVSARKPLFMDESAHDWQLVRLGRELGWTGVALKTCKTQTGALLSLCWAKAHGMTLMVQDLTNPMLAQIPHVLLAAHAGTIMGVETNAMQFYPDASLPEEAVHPGLYRRRAGHVDLSCVRGAGFGYRLAEIERKLPPAACAGQDGVA